MMDFQTMVTNAVTAARVEELKKLPVLTLGELIAKLEEIERKDPSRLEKYGEGNYPHVQFDFCGMEPTTLDSWRGVYAELALGYAESAYPKECSLSELLAELRSGVGKTFQGWKGGDLTMGRGTPVCVANPGRSGNTAIVDVLDEEHTVILLTTYIA